MIRSIIKLWLWIKISFVAIWVQLALYFMKLPGILEVMEFRPKKLISEEEIQYGIEMIESLSNARWFIIRRNCLKKNLLYYFFLVTSGMTGLTLHIGISKLQENLDGHCWLTLNGKVYLDSEQKISKYKAIYSRGV